MLTPHPLLSNLLSLFAAVSVVPKTISSWQHSLTDLAPANPFFLSLSEGVIYFSTYPNLWPVQALN